MTKSLSIVLPCYNPQLHGDWVAVVVANMHRIRAAVPDCELVLVNDGTPVSLQEDLASLQAQLDRVRVISYAPNRGKGYAIRQGIAAAGGELIIYTDIDFPYRHESLMQVYESLHRPGADIVVGVKDTEYYSAVPPARRKVSELLRWMIRRLLHVPITDTQCGLKGFRAPLKPLWLAGKIDRYLFDLEMVYNADRQGYHLQALPVTLREGVQFSQVKGRLLLAELRNFLAIARQSRSDRRKPS